MQPWRSDPYLWVHLAGLATVPLWIDLCCWDWRWRTLPCRV